MADWEQEGQRFVELAREVQSINHHKIPVTCGMCHRCAYMQLECDIDMYHDQNQEILN